MLVKKLALNNFRGARSLTLGLHRKLNVFLGENGAGKSTVLDAVAIMLSWMASRTRHASSSGRPIVEDDITNDESNSSIEIFCSDLDADFDWRLSKNRKGHAHSEDRSNLSPLNDFLRRTQERIASHKERVNIPLLVYYPVHRAVLDIPLRIRGKHNFGLLASYDDSLSSGANFRTFFEWFREREDLENENGRHRDLLVKPEGYAFPDPQLQAVRSALTQFLPEFTHISVTRSPLRMVLEKNGKNLSVNQLSNGEKCFLAMIGDLARRMAIANPLMSDPLHGEGIVLVDEVDLHLHPKWQRTIVPSLTRVFPNCQFLISTHSPLVATHVQSDSVYVLKQLDGNIESNHPPESYGKNADRILEDLMGLTTTRPEEINQGLQAVFREIRDNQLGNARNMINTLRLSIGDDPELIKAENLVIRKESIGK